MFPFSMTNDSFIVIYLLEYAYKVIYVVIFTNPFA